MAAFVQLKLGDYEEQVFVEMPRVFKEEGCIPRVHCIMG
jgi:hypothetical protein